MEQVDWKKGYIGSFIISVISPKPQFECGYRIVTGAEQLSALKFGLLMCNDDGEISPPINTFSGLLLLINEPVLVDPSLRTSPVTTI